MNSIVNLFPVDPHYVPRTRFTRARSPRAAANEFERVRKRKLRAPRLRRSFACLTRTHRAIIPSLNQSALPILANVPPGNREVKLIVFHSSFYNSYVYEAAARNDYEREIRYSETVRE